MVHGMSHLLRGARAHFRRRVWSLLVRDMSSIDAEALSSHVPYMSRVCGRLPCTVRAASSARIQRTPAHKVEDETVPKT